VEGGGVMMIRGGRKRERDGVGEEVREDDTEKL
jgi:hypothetical protein